MIIRQAVADDLTAMVDLESRSFPNPWSAASVGSEMCADDRVVLVIEDRRSNPSLLASLVLRLVSSEAELLRIAVRPGWRRQGLGRRLLKMAHRRLADSGIQTCYLEVREDNIPARALYDGFGARVASVRTRYFDDDTDAIVLAIDLAGTDRSPERGG